MSRALVDLAERGVRAEAEATLVRVRSGAPGRRPTVMLAPDMSAEQGKAVQVFELDRWMPSLLSSS